MFKLTFWDGAIVVLYVCFCLTVAFSLKRRGERHGLKSFVAADRNMPWWLLGTSMVAMMSSALAGISGILVTDFVMFILKLIAAIAVCVYAVKQPAVGGLHGLIDWYSTRRPEYLHFMPSMSAGSAVQLTIGALALYLTVRWWAQIYGGAEPGGGVYVAQRMLAAKNEKHALYATLWFNIAHYAVRPWPWILTGLACLILFPHAERPDVAYIRCIDFVPPGLKGLVLAGFFAALLAIDTRLDRGAAYRGNDLYQ